MRVVFMATAAASGVAIPLASFVTIRRFIDRNLKSPELSPEMIARNFGLSRASLYRLFEPGGGIDHLANAHALMRRVDRGEIDNCLAGFDSDAQPEGRVRRCGPALAGMRRAKRAERVVRMSGRRPEERVHGVADVLLDDATLGNDARAHRGECPVERTFQPFGAQPNGEVGRSDDVDEHTGHEAALFPCFGHGGSIGGSVADDRPVTRIGSEP